MPRAPKKLFVQKYGTIIYFLFIMDSDEGEWKANYS